MPNLMALLTRFSAPIQFLLLEGSMIWAVLGLLVVIALILVIIGFRSERR